MVRIVGDEASILAVVEVLKVALIAVCMAALVNLDTIWCMYTLRSRGEFTLLALNANHPPHAALLGAADGRKRFVPVRTALLVISVSVSIADVVALFSLSTEGTSVGDKPEFGFRMQDASDVPARGRMLFYNPHEAQLRYEFVLRRLGKMMQFRNGSHLKIDVPRPLDTNLNEKWPYAVPLSEQDKYATVFSSDFVSDERANFSEAASQVTGMTESGKLLRHYAMAKKDADRKVCSGSISAITTTGVNRSATFCYTDELRNSSCANKTNGESVPFTMKCSEIRVERFGANIIFENDSIWWLNRFATIGRADKSLLQMNSLRAYKRDDVSPSAMIVAAVLTEFPSQVVLVRRKFFTDVSVVIIPNWLIISSAAVFSFIMFSSVSASIYAKAKNLVILSSWKEMLIWNLLEPLDCLNRANKREFRCVVGGGDEYCEKKYRLFVEPNHHVEPVKLVRRHDIG